MTERRGPHLGAETGESHSIPRAFQQRGLRCPGCGGPHQGRPGAPGRPHREVPSNPRSDLRLCPQGQVRPCRLERVSERCSLVFVVVC